MKLRLSPRRFTKTRKIANLFSSADLQTPYYTHSGLSHCMTREAAEPYLVLSIITEP